MMSSEKISHEAPSGAPPDQHSLLPELWSGSSNYKSDSNQDVPTSNSPSTGWPPSNEIHRLLDGFELTEEAPPSVPEARASEYNSSEQAENDEVFVSLSLDDGDTEVEVRVEQADPRTTEPLRRLLSETVTQLNRGQFQEAYDLMRNANIHPGDIRILTQQTVLEVGAVNPTVAGTNATTNLSNHLHTLGRIACAYQVEVARPNRPLQLTICEPVTVLRLSSGTTVDIMRPTHSLDGRRLTQQADIAEVEGFLRSAAGRTIQERHAIIIAEEFTHLHQIDAEHRAISRGFTEFARNQGRTVTVPEGFPAEQHVNWVNGEREIPFLFQEAGMPFDDLVRNFGHHPERQGAVFEQLRANSTAQPSTVPGNTTQEGSRERTTAVEEARPASTTERPATENSRVRPPGGDALLSSSVTLNSERRTTDPDTTSRSTNPTAGERTVELPGGLRVVVNTNLDSRTMEALERLSNDESFRELLEQRLRGEPDATRRRELQSEYDRYQRMTPEERASVRESVIREVVDMHNGRQMGRGRDFGRILGWAGTAMVIFMAFDALLRAAPSAGQSNPGRPVTPRVH